MHLWATVISPSDNLLPQLLSKQRPFEFSRKGAPLEESSRSDDDYIFNDCEILAAMDEKFRDLLQFEALKRVQCYMKTFLQNEADRISRRGEHADTEGKDTKIVVPVVLIPFVENELAKLETRLFIFKLWLCRIDLMRGDENEKYAILLDFERAIYDAQEAIKKYKNLFTRNITTQKNYNTCVLSMKNVLRKR